MSNQYAHIYQQQQSRLYTSPEYSTTTADDYPPRPNSSQVYAQPTYQSHHVQPLSPPVSPVPLHYLAHTHQVDHFSSQLASNYHPIPAPSPQYPQQLPTIPHVSYSSPPTSPVSNGIPRRPLPTPGAPPSQVTSPAFRPPLPTHGPPPIPTSPPSHARSLGPGSLPSSGVTLPSPQLPSTLPSTSPTSPTSIRRPLPLPRTAPGSSSDLAIRSSSPAKDVARLTSASPVAASLLNDPSTSGPLGTKFIPYWKRSLPDPSSDRAAASTTSLQEVMNSGPSGPSSSVPSPDTSEPPRDRSKSFTSGRPLPPSPLDGSAGKPPFIPPTISLFGEGARVLPNPSSSPVRASTLPTSPIKLAKSSSSLPAAAGSSGHFSTRPASPARGSVPPRPISPSSSDDDENPSQNGKAPQEVRISPSPQYGILDLPPKSRSVISRNNTKHTRAPASIDQDKTDEPPRGRSNRSSTLPQPPLQSLSTQSSHRSTQSATLRSAPVLPPAAGPSQFPVSTPTSPTGWANSLAPLPRAPKPGAKEQPSVNRTRNSKQEYVNLDDAPPPSLRRSPSPSGVANRPVPRIKTRSMASSSHKPPLTHDSSVPPRRNAASVPSSPDKVTVNLPDVSSTSVHQGTRSRSITPGSVRQPPVAPVERPRAQPTPVSRPPPSAFSQRFVSGKPAPAEPQVTTTRVTIPHISTPGGGGGNLGDDGGNASIIVSEPELPQITFSDPTASALDADYSDASPIDETRRDPGPANNTPSPATGGGRIFPPASSARRGGGLACGGCGGPIVGRIVSAMGVRWHPGCFRCSDCNSLLEYVSSYERDGKPYCHLDYHEVRLSFYC